MSHVTYESWRVSRLKPHPLNVTIFGGFGDQDYHELVESIKQIGIIAPVIVTADGVIISGHRRVAAAPLANLDVVPVIVRRDITDKVDIDKLWLDSNRNRVITNEQRARWFDAQRKIELEWLKKHRPDSAASTELVEEASQRAAREVGWGRSTANHAAVVTHAIDKAEAAGDTETANELRKKLNDESVNAAYKATRQRKKAQKSGEPKAEQPAPQESIRDSLGKPVPEHLIEAFLLSTEIDELIRKLDATRREVSALSGRPGGQHLNVGFYAERLKELRDVLAQARYWTVCPRCNGSACDWCRDTGFLPFAFKSRLAENDKATIGV